MSVHSIATGIKPLHYDLHVEPDLEAGTFTGMAAINVELLGTVSSISLHAKNLDITMARVTEGTKPVETLDRLLNTELEMVTILLAAPLAVGTILKLRLIYSGSLDHDRDGFLRTKLNNRPGEPKWMASTFTQPTAARMIFPCFDEPSLKATFSMTILTEKHLTCLSNMPIQTKEVSLTKQLVTFERTPPMSTYLVAFAIGKFHMIESHEFRKPLRIYAPVQYQIEDCRYALDMAHRALSIYEVTFGIEYTLPKLDILVLPNTTFGMENWGLITGSFAKLLIGSDSTAADKVASASLIVHEIAHQWFGNLVTIAWWDDLWLQEGFAEWSELYCRSQMGEEWEPWLEFRVGDWERAMRLDTWSESDELGMGVQEPDEIEEKFNKLSYFKGCAMLKMLEGWLGEEVFLGGVRVYLKRHKYGNVKAGDLWQALGEVSGEEIEAVMRPWIHEAGFPLLVVEDGEVDADGQCSITLSQQRFLANGQKVVMELPIPLDIDGTKMVLVGGPGSSSVSVQGSCYRINSSATVFGRIAYPLSRLRVLSQNLEQLAVVERIALVLDTAALCFANLAGYLISDLLSFLQQFHGETNYFVWIAIFASLRELQRRVVWEDRRVKEGLIRFQTKLVWKALEASNSIWDSDSIDEQRLKALLFENGGQRTREAAGLMWHKWNGGDRSFINPNLRAGVFAIALANGSIREYNILYSRLASTASYPERRDILAALGHSTHLRSIRKTLLLAQKTQNSRDSAEDAVGTQSMVANLMSTAKGVRLMFEILKFRNLSDEQLSSMNKEVVPELLLNGLGTRKQEAQARKLLRGRGSAEFRRAVEVGLEALAARVCWVERERAGVVAWLREGGYWGVRWWGLSGNGGAREGESVMEKADGGEMRSERGGDREEFLRVMI